jgi:hypothetical protein
MYISHEFAHPQTLARAKYWLACLGFRPEEYEASSEGVPRLAVIVEPGRHAQVELLIDALESADPDGWPTFWDLAHQPHAHWQASHAAAEPPREEGSQIAIHWQRIDQGTPEYVELLEENSPFAFLRH